MNNINDRLNEILTEAKVEYFNSKDLVEKADWNNFIKALEAALKQLDTI